MINEMNAGRRLLLLHLPQPTLVLMSCNKSQPSTLGIGPSRRKVATYPLWAVGVALATDIRSAILGGCVASVCVCFLTPPQGGAETEVGGEGREDVDVDE